MNQRTLIISLSVILIIVIGASLGVLVFLPGDTDTQPPITGSTQVSVPSGSTASSDVFNMSVLDRAAYKALNAGLLQSGRLPVQPPVGTGKSNPFL
ncbi:MAG: hypothetical protein WD200_05230 [Candidatus Andersenbacteria bacterium]